ERAQQGLRGVELIPRIVVEAEMTLKEANWEVIDQLEKFEPFGEGNREPLFLTKNLTVKEIATMGTTGQHLRLALEDSMTKIGRKFVGFGLALEWGEKIKVGSRVDVVYEFGVNEWNGNRELQFKIVDLKLGE
ncbi:MAG TPA: single-stranded-DNA-specific exonuclease RecJ, partial [Patescibacteria group bacterium]|nr:single-stranded-DNA-specific exonuclease RecJ [Patescibacteria group bacterium]